MPKPFPNLPCFQLSSAVHLLLTPLSNMSMTPISSFTLSLLEHQHHCSPTNSMKTWVLPIPTTIPYHSLVPQTQSFGKMTLPSISLIGAAAFKWLINAGEEVYTINIQLISNYLDIEGLCAVSHQPTVV